MKRFTYLFFCSLSLLAVSENMDPVQNLRQTVMDLDAKIAAGPGRSAEVYRSYLLGSPFYFRAKGEEKTKQVEARNLVEAEKELDPLCEKWKKEMQEKYSKEIFALDCKDVSVKTLGASFVGYAHQLNDGGAFTSRQVELILPAPSRAFLWETQELSSGVLWQEDHYFKRDSFIRTLKEAKTAWQKNCDAFLKDAYSKKRTIRFVTCAWASEKETAGFELKNYAPPEAYTSGVTIEFKTVGKVQYLFP